MKPPEDTAPLVPGLSQTEWTDEELAWSHRMARLILGPAFPEAPAPAPAPAPVDHVDAVLSVDLLVKPLDPPV